MKRILTGLVTLAISATVLTSCLKEEKPYSVPTPPTTDGDYELQNNKVTMGEDYETQIYFSFTNGQIASNSYKIWDLAFSTKADSSEVWMNGVNGVQIYTTNKFNFAEVITGSGLTLGLKPYDDPNGLSGQSALGLLNAGHHIGEILVVKKGAEVFKLQITEATTTGYKLLLGPVTATQGQEILLEKNDDYNFAFYSFATGIVYPEPPKKDWDIVFTRYQHLYYAYNTDGSDLAYPVTGVLANPYKTLSWSDSTKTYEFYDFTLDIANTKQLAPNRDKIGHNWKSVNLNTNQFSVNTKRVFLLRDQNEILWKFRFVNFYDENNRKGSPQFEYQRLK